MFDGIVLHQAQQRFQRYQNKEKLDDFFQALMETKDGVQRGLEWGEIVAEISITCMSTRCGPSTLFEDDADICILQ